ncbi:hypothetical protein HH207_04610 [Corynebacterium pseudodiphtheriticum]|nr:hypothetical protein HH207_04610 [Corynebacterium pseudodiphtheriticum]UNU78264.1 hypothetical protein HH208_07610 [Corynebacterium pseudodiphtheriticum]
MTYISLGMLAVSSSLWAIYMQDNAIVLVGLLFGTALTAWQIHHYRTTIPTAVNSIAIAAGALSALGFVVRENFSSSAIAFLSFGTAGALIAYVVFAAVMIIKSQQKSRP